MTLTASLASAATSAGAPITSGGNYDRNPSVVHDGDTTWMFFARSENNDCNRLDGCDADNINYDLYYQQSADGGATWGSPTLLVDNAIVPRGVFPEFRGRTVAATRTADGALAVFWAPGGHSGTLYWVTKPADSSSWQPGFDDTRHYFNVEAVSKGDDVFVYTETCCEDGDGVQVSTFDATANAISAPTMIFPGRNLPKAIVDGAGAFRLTMVHIPAWPVVNVEVASSADGLTWSPPTVAVAGDGTTTNWDPTLVQTADGVYHLFHAPDLGDGNQRVEERTSADFVTWSAGEPVTAPADWWDYWPEAQSIDGVLRLFFTSEAPTSAGDDAGTGHIWSSGTKTVPTHKDQCKNGGYVAFGFSNQGQCVSSVAKAGKGS